jgi:hypothetical protein
MTQNKDQKCAPSKIYTEGSCFTLESLINIANSYNNSIKQSRTGRPIKIKKNKRHLVIELTDRLQNVCKDQLCWLKQKFVKDLKNVDINNDTFRPKGPGGKFDWLSTTNINDVMDQYHSLYKDFRFFGAVPIDFDDLPSLGIQKLNFDKLYKDGGKRLGFVFNLDEHWKSGSHWVALYTNLKKKQIFYFDSYGQRPEKRIRKLVKRLAKWMNNNKKGGYSSDNTIEEFNGNDSSSVSYMKPNKKNKLEKKFKIEYNQNRHQFKNSECGVYSMNFIIRLLHGETFKDITEKKTLDDKMNYCRGIYFNNKNLK